MFALLIDHFFPALAAHLTVASRTISSIRTGHIQRLSSSHFVARSYPRSFSRMLHCITLHDSGMTARQLPSHFVIFGLRARLQIRANSLLQDPAVF